MATTTTNFGWDIPQSTDLVKDGATAIAALGQDIDTALVDLKGGTTGQVLAKASGTDLDFSWVAQDDSNAIQNAIVDAKGDLITATAPDTPARLAVGTNGYVLTADSAEATGLKWAAAGADSHTLIATASLSGATAIQFASIPTTYTHLYCVFIDCYSSSSYWNVRFNNDSGNNYNTQASAGSTSSGNSGVAFAGAGDQNARLGIIPQTFTGTANGTANGQMQIFNYKSTTLKRAGIWQSTGYDGSYYAVAGSFAYNSTGTAITQIDFVRGSTQTISGTIQLWGVK